jgi:predicted RecB family nuclease
VFVSDSDLVLAPTDLASFLSCRHRTGLDLAGARGVLARPVWSDPVGPAMRARGLEHERRYVAWLRAPRGDGGHDLVDLSDLRDGDADAATRAAMSQGAAAIVQAALSGPDWRGTADVLVRVECASALGAWSYEVHDTKLARETRGGTILQLCAYSDLLAGVQGVAPEWMRVVVPGDDHSQAGFFVESYRFDEYAAFYRRVRTQLLAAVAHGHDILIDETYPEPVEACELCRWWPRCNALRRADDHLSFIAGIGRWHRTELTAQGYGTLALAASMPVPIAFTPSHGSRATYGRLREQARLQHQQRSSLLPVFEALPVQPGQGLCRLPAPSPGDLFLDLEGARFARAGGREYLFGISTGVRPLSSLSQTSGEAGLEKGLTPYRCWWSHDDGEERAAFEAVMDVIEAQWTRHPDMHVYHFAPYEPSAFKRLMGRHATRADLLDRLLRGERFVDLLAVVRQSLRAGVESYSIKELERFYGFERTVPLDEAAANMRAIELALEGLATGTIPPETRAAVEGYNHDDCRSTAALRDWLEGLRTHALAGGVDIPRPRPKEDAAPERVGDLEARQQAARARLLDGLALDAATPGHPDHPRWLLAYLVDWHRREDKAQYWERYRLNDLSDEELVDERQAITGLEFVERQIAPGKKRGTARTVDRYLYPPQDTELRANGELLIQGGPTRIGDIDSHDRAARVIAIRKAAVHVDVHPAAVFQATVVASDEQQKALLRFCELGEANSAGLDLLHRRPPRLRTGSLDAQPGESLADRGRRLVVSLDRTTLAVQGPPGAGKTYLGAQMIRALVTAGRRVGVVAQTHKVIVNLLDAVAEQARTANEPVRLGRKVGSDEEVSADSDTEGIRGFDDNDEARAALAERTVDVLGGTAWLWAREQFVGSVDVLVVDEAGQFSLANALAVSAACDSLVLLGDPQQLTQPQKGSHPDGVDASALRHVLGDQATMPDDRGLFLPTTWRMSPAICSYASEQFYDGKLTSREGLERQRLAGTDGLDGSGLSWCPVTHAGNRHWSAEEIDAVDALATRLLAPGARWIDGDDTAHPLRGEDILVVAPYNAQVIRLAERLGDRGVRVGTVDRFQGQEAPVVIYAMAASTPADAPRGMEFLYSRHRLNVATSRARCAAIVVASPALLEPECRTPQQMRLANALCRFVEMARTSSGGGAPVRRAP